MEGVDATFAEAQGTVLSMFGVVDFDRVGAGPQAPVAVRFRYR